jgi:hypothetical protein
MAFIIAIRHMQSIFDTKTADPLQHVQEAVLGKGEVCQLQLFLAKMKKCEYIKNKNISTALYYINILYCY